MRGGGGPRRLGWCPRCGGELVLRVRVADAVPFSSCLRFTERSPVTGGPVCTYTAPLPAWLEMERAGAARLPGLEEG